MSELIHSQEWQNRRTHSPFALGHTWYNMKTNSLECTHCGTVQPVKLPMPMARLGTACLLFHHDHKKCKPKNKGGA